MPIQERRLTHRSLHICLLATQDVELRWHAWYAVTPDLPRLPHPVLLKQFLARSFATAVGEEGDGKAGGLPISCDRLGSRAVSYWCVCFRP